jgi:HD superfamily phosphohydrolase
MGGTKKQISDPIHGVIPLTDVEVALVKTRAFQRLRNIKQLGLAHYVFPGADYSRFSHSLGACHVMGKIMKALQAQHPKKFDDQRVQQYKIAALLHDIGHYPFSHATEYALKEASSGSLLKGSSGDIERSIMHDSVSGLVLSEDAEIRSVLSDAAISAKDVEDTFRRQRPSELLSNLISSDLDADRIDYLLRTAHFAGLPYGSVDVDYLLTQVRLDSDGKVCLASKALRAAEHLLLCRYFDYKQVTYHKAVVGFEWLLRRSIIDLVTAGTLNGTEGEVRRLVASGQWASFDDSSLWEKIRDLQLSADKEVALRARCILDRVPPVVLYDDEAIIPRSDLTNGQREKLLRRVVKECVQQFGMSETALQVWTPGAMTLTKAGGRIDVSDLESSDPKKHDALDQAVRILNDDGTSSPIQNDKRSLMSVLAEHGVKPIRVYALLAEDDRSQVDAMRKKLRDDMA